MLFRGTLRSISYPKGAEIWLSSRHVLLKDFGAYAAKLTAQLRAHATAVAAEFERPIEYLASSHLSKEDRARAIQQRDGITDGLICVFSCVEPCRAVTVRPNRQTRRLHVVTEDRKCVHLYFYYADRDFGLLHIRLQTWLPFTLQVCLNGRDWLAHQLTQRGIAHTRVDNCLTAVASPTEAQRLLDQLAARQWAPLLRQLAERVNPLVRRGSRLSLRSYYWSLQESEVASDVLFHRAADLATLYPALTRHAIEAFGAEDVLRFLGRRMGGRSTGEVTSSYLRRPEGVRVKHWVEENSLKMYDKAGSVLRVEITINQPRRFLVYRERTRKGHRRRCWGRMRKGIADLPRRVELSRAALARYLDALSTVPDPTPVAHMLDPVSQRRLVDGRPYRALRPIALDDNRVFAALLEGGAVVHGCRPADLRRVLSPDEPTTTVERRRLTGRVSRVLRLYRAHGLIAKIARTHRYRVTSKGQQVMSAAIRLRVASIATLAA
jgi:hypothetical protein